MQIRDHLGQRQADHVGVRAAQLGHEGARDALLIDVNNAEAKDTLIEALKQQKKTAEIEKIEKRYK